jgi:hypothetical protein
VTGASISFVAHVQSDPADTPTSVTAVSAFRANPGSGRDPYGPDYPYMMRRLAERPAKLAFLLHSLVQK